MSSQYDAILDHARRTLLNDGEEILWTGRPDVGLRVLSVLHWVVLSGLGFAVLELGNAIVRFAIFEALALVGLWAFLYLRGRGVHYLITGQRIILIKAGGDFPSTSYPAHDLRHAKPYVGQIGGIGGINFTGHEPFPGELQGLWGIRDVGEVEDLITAIRNGAIDDPDD